VCVVLALAVSVVLTGGGAGAGSGTARARPNPTTPPPTQPPLDRRVVIIGDSVILGARNDLYARLGYAGWNITAFAAEESFFTFDAPALIDRLRPYMGEVVVIELGANDGADPWQFVATVNTVMTHLEGIPRVYWVNMRHSRRWVPAANSVIAAAATRYPTLRVIDWDARSTPDPFTVYSDGLHLPPYGRAAMAEVVAVALDGYIAERTTPPTTAPPAASDTEVAFARAHGIGALHSGVSEVLVLGIAGLALLVVGAAVALRSSRAHRSTLGGR
jgi:hypothetical protein